MKTCVLISNIFFMFFLINIQAHDFHTPIPIDIQKAIIKYEGGFSDDPRDAGGATKYGWTLKTYKGIYPDAGIHDLKNLTREQAILLYEKHYWWIHGTQYIKPEDLAGTLLLAQINLGAARPNKLLENLSNELCDSNLKIDGQLHKVDVHAINHCKYLSEAFPYILWHDKYMKFKSISWAKKGLRKRVLNYVN